MPYTCIGGTWDGRQPEVPSAYREVKLPTLTFSPNRGPRRSATQETASETKASPWEIYRLENFRYYRKDGDLVERWFWIEESLSVDDAYVRLVDNYHPWPALTTAAAALLPPPEKVSAR